MQVSRFPVIGACSFLSGPEKIAHSAMGPTSNAPGLPSTTQSS